MIPDGRLLMLDGVGHVAQMEVPHLVARAAIAARVSGRTVPGAIHGVRVAG